MRTKKSHKKNKADGNHPFIPFQPEGRGSISLDPVTPIVHEPNIQALEKLLKSNLDTQQIMGEGDTKKLEQTLMHMVPFAGISEYVLSNEALAGKSTTESILSESTYYNWLKGEWETDVVVNIFSEEKYAGKLNPNTIVEIDIQGDDDVVYGVICYFEKNVVTPIALYADNDYYPLATGKRVFPAFVQYILGDDYARSFIG